MTTSHVYGAGVVVIDDQPEVSIDDPAFLFESNEGFQEVTSRKALKSKQKAAQEEALRQIHHDEQLQLLLLQQQNLIKLQQSVSSKKKDKEGKGGKRTLVAEKRLSKLPPRLAKARELKEREKQQKGGTSGAKQLHLQQQQVVQPLPPATDHQPPGDSILPKIENWNNEMANNIPRPSVDSVPQDMKPQDASVHRGLGSVNLAGTPYSMGMPIPAPAPAVNAWDTPLSVAPPPPLLVSTAPTVHIPSHDVKFGDKGDQHDSGIDISEPLNSGDSSTRNSPSADSKLKTDDLLCKVRVHICC